jgi:hypothetical protein
MTVLPRGLRLRLLPEGRSPLAPISRYRAVHKAEGNRYANEALTLALGLRKKMRPNWSCCHIWGVDDARYQLSNVVIIVLLRLQLWACEDEFASVGKARSLPALANPALPPSPSSRTPL